MHTLGDELQRIKKKMARVENEIEERTAELVRLRSERTELEMATAAHRIEADGRRAALLCEWCVVLP